VVWAIEDESVVVVLAELRRFAKVLTEVVVPTVLTVEIHCWMNEFSTVDVEVPAVEVEVPMVVS